ncbi:MAG TPA: hypothetical protein VN247_07555 [Arenimonas sp.]|nr:hypothetical protein [Arenimonas sp.]
MTLLFALKPAGLVAAVNVENVDSLPQLQELIESEFAYQNGNFSQAFSYYKQRPFASFSQQELVRGAELALATGDAAWLQGMLNTPDGKSSQQQEILKIKLAQSIQLSQVAQIQQAWQGLIRLSESQGAKQARRIILQNESENQSTLISALELYAKQTDLKQFELFELFQYAWQWDLDALAITLQNRLELNSSEARLVYALVACKAKITSNCVQRIEKLNSDDFDESQKSIVLQLARQSGDASQLQRWLAAQAQNGATYYQRIALLGKLMDKTKADALVAEIGRDADLSAFQRAVLLGSLAELQQQWSEAEGFYQQALLQKTPSTATIRLAVVLFRQNKNEQAFAWLEKIQKDTNLSDELRREAFLTEVQFYKLKSGAFNQQNANEVLLRALGVWPLAHRIRYQYAMRLVEQGQTKTSLAELEKILKFAPTDANVLNAYGYTLAKDFNRPKVAFKPIEQAYLLAPNRAEILDSYGYVLHRLGRNNEALQPLQMAWKLTPSAVTAGHLAMVYWQLGDKEQANDYLQKGLVLDKNDAELLQFKELLP